VEAGEAEYAMVSLIQQSPKSKYSNVAACYSFVTITNGFHFMVDDCPSLTDIVKFMEDTYN
jgi:hypothetical protein